MPIALWLSAGTTLESTVRDAKGATRKLGMQHYTYFNVRGEYEMNWMVATGEAARQELQTYRALYDSYFGAIQEYQKKTAEYEAKLQSLVARIQRLKAGHKDAASLQRELTALVARSAPSATSRSVEPPVPLQQGFIVNLSPGRYSLRLTNADERTMEGSEKTLIVYEPNRTGGIGFEVIPGDKWTRPQESISPASVLYVDGSADLYVRPFFEDELNDLEHEKTIDNAARGNPNVARWVRIQQVPRATVAVKKGGRDGGSAIRETMLRGAGAGHQPGIHHCALGPERSQQERAASGLLIALAQAPLLALIAMLVLRARVYSARSARDG